MASTPPTTQSSTPRLTDPASIYGTSATSSSLNSGYTMPSDIQQTILDAAADSIHIGSGRGGKLYGYQNILSQHDRYGSSPVQVNKELVGMTFFTRPRLNMATRSIRQDRTLAMLDTLNPLSWMFALRCNLDSVFAQSQPVSSLVGNCPWFNNTSAFNIPLSNLLLGMSGFPDFGVETETTESGYYCEDMTTVRGSDWGRRTYDITCTFRDIQGGYLMAYFYYWLRAMALQMDGTIVAYPDDREANRLNYTCSIYRFILDPYQKTIVKWSKATGCYPVNVPIGSCFDFGPGDSYIHASQQFTIPFRCNNVTYMDPLHLAAFNILVQRYAGSALNTDSSRQKMPIDAMYNFKGLPWVDLVNGTNELCFYATTAELTNLANQSLTQLQSTLAQQLGITLPSSTISTNLNGTLTTTTPSPILNLSSL